MGFPTDDGTFLVQENIRQLPLKKIFTTMHENPSLRVRCVRRVRCVYFQLEEVEKIHLLGDILVT
ncbi:MAG: hypothetical protein F6K31_05255 [Symploca sp. SIO2G7]|nr:hypothetical protein [Symploca sp. SIO2G7]